MLTALVGCAGSQTGDPVTTNPGGTDLTAAAEQNSTPEALPVGNSLLGYYEVVIDLEAGTVEFVAMRTAEMHFNLVPVLEGAIMNLGLASPPSIAGGVLSADIVLTHPFAGKLNLSGFDVKGILITEGSKTGFGDPDIKIAGPNETRLLNADGFTRWWNPAEFLLPGLSGYSPGKLGGIIDPANSAILNGYKLFSDDLEADEPIAASDLSQRALFMAGSSNVRHYQIRLASGLKFNYAVDCSWAPAVPNPPVNLPDDFPPEANQAEAWFIEVSETNNTLWYKDGEWGGNVSYDITVHDWQSSGGIGTLTIEAPGVFTNTASVPLSATEFTMTYHFDFVLPDMNSNDPLDVLISIDAEGDYDSFLTGVTKPLRAYHRHLTDVSDTNPIFNQPPVALMEATTATEIFSGESVTFDASASWDPDGFVAQWIWDFNGDGFYNDTYESGTDENPTRIFTSDESTTFLVTLKVRDNESSSNISEPVEIFVTLITNDAPFAVAEATTTTDILEDETVSFDGSASYDMDGTVVEWKWDFDEDGIYDDPYTGDEQTPTATFPNPGTFYVDLQVRDDGNASGTLDETIQINVENVLIEPTAVAEATTPGEIDACGSVTFDAGDSFDTDGTIEQYLWDFDGDATYGDLYDSGTDENPTKVYTDPGTFDVDLKVVDDEALEGTLDTPIQITVTNVDPVADAVATTPTDIYGGQEVTFDASGSTDPDCDDIVSYEWDFDGDTTFGDPYDSGTDVNPTKVFTDQGSYNVSVQVTDGNSGTDTFGPIVVNVTNNPPTACAEITSSYPYWWEEWQDFSAACSEDVDGTIVSWEWDLDADGTYEETGETASYYFEFAGQYDMQLRVQDDEGDYSLLVTPLNFWIFDDSNMPPTINEVTHSRTTSQMNNDNEAVQLGVDFEDLVPPGDTHTYLWTSDYGSFDNDTSPTPIWYPPSEVVNCDINVTITDAGGMFDDGSCHQWVTQWPVHTDNPNAPNGSEIISYTMYCAINDVDVDPADFHFPDIYPNGTVLYMNVWATWCPPCVGEMPTLHDIYLTYKDQDYIHMEIDINETEAQIENFVALHGLEASYWPMDPGVYFWLCNDWNDDSNGIPQHWIFDRDGRIRGHQLGGIGTNASMITKYIDELI